MSNRQRILVIVLALLPVVLAAGMWVRSYWRRDQLGWGMDRAESRRVSCRVYSSWGRVYLLSYSRPSDGTDDAERLSLQSGDRTSTEAMADAARNQLQQAGVMSTSQWSLAYSQHVGSMSAGTHVWTAAVVPWWVFTAIALAVPAYAVRSLLRRRTATVDEPPAA
jgi:hypothetical protein